MLIYLIPCGIPFFFDVISMKLLEKKIRGIVYYDIPRFVYLNRPIGFLWVF